MLKHSYGVLVYLNINKTYRVFRDRLIDDNDRLNFSEMSH